jgi:hypothetical protein
MVGWMQWAELAAACHQARQEVAAAVTAAVCPGIYLLPMHRWLLRQVICQAVQPLCCPFYTTVAL